MHCNKNKTPHTRAAPAGAHKVCVIALQRLVEALCQAAFGLQQLRLEALADLERVLQALLILLGVAGTLLHKDLVVAACL